MQSSTILLSLLTGTAMARYQCQTNVKRNDIEDAWVTRAVAAAGGITTGKSGFPHEFGGTSGKQGTPVLVWNNAACNNRAVGVTLHEYPVLLDAKSTYPKDVKRNEQSKNTPVRVVYLQDGTICGVMTHVEENRDTHQGLGDFAVCTYVAGRMMGFLVQDEKANCYPDSEEWAYQSPNEGEEVIQHAAPAPVNVVVKVAVEYRS